MDFLVGSELERYRRNALHTSRIPQTVYDTNKSSLFETIDERNQAQIDDFAQRRARTKLAGFSSTAVGGDVFAAIPRFYSPLEYFEQTQIPYDINNKKHRFELYKWLDLFYRTHYLIPILVDIFTRFPLVGLDLFGPDESLNNFYRDAFLDRLDYEQFFVDLGREYWVLGQSFPMGEFNEMLGIWETEELMDPTLIEVKRFPIIGGEEFFIVPPKELVDLVKNKRPRPQYVLLEKNYPDLIPFLRNGKNIPVSDVLMRQVAFKASPRDLYGTPLLLRALRTLMHEEKLMASQDAIAERLYSPLILAKIGTPEMGSARTPWIPGPNEISAFRNDLDLALSSDFRLLVHHFAIDVQNVFGREQMPRLDNDFDRVEKRIMQCVPGDTLIHTKEGVLPAKELVGREIDTLSKGGIYRKAEWKNYGKQEIYDVILENGDVLRATEFHKWPVLKNGKWKWVLTPDLVGERIPIQYYDEFNYDQEEWEEGVRHGLVNGDGWLYSNKHFSMIRQYADNRELLRTYFSEYREVEITDGRVFTEVKKLPSSYKTDLPFEKSTSYIRGFLAGIIAADGCVDDTGHVTLHSKERDKLEEIRRLAIKGGIPTLKISSNRSTAGRITPSGHKMSDDYLMYKLSFVKAGFLTKEGVDENMILKNSHRLLMKQSGTKRKRWSVKVASVFCTGALEETYCCAEQETHTFVMENCYLTGNTFGVSPSLLSGGQASTPYASSALQAEFLNQILRTYQRYLIRHYESRAKIVAEAHEHYDYEQRGQTRVPIMEEVLITDEEGQQRIEKRNKLMIPEMRMKVLDLRDEATQRNFLQALKQQGVPIPDSDITMGMHYDFKESLNKVSEEMIAKTVAQQDAKLKTYDILIAEGLPIPPNLLAEMQAAGFAPGGMSQGGEGGGPMGPVPSDTFGNPLGPGNPSTGGGGILMPPPPGAAEGNKPMRGTVPEISNERREQNNPNPGKNSLSPKGPMIPGVPGQMGMYGPGSPTPAIGPTPTGQPGFRHTHKESKSEIDENGEVREYIESLHEAKRDVSHKFTVNYERYLEEDEDIINSNEPEL